MFPLHLRAQPPGAMWLAPHFFPVCSDVLLSEKPPLKVPPPRTGTLLLCPHLYPALFLFTACLTTGLHVFTYSLCLLLTVYLSPESKALCSLPSPQVQGQCLARSWHSNICRVTGPCCLLHVYLSLIWNPCFVPDTTRGSSCGWFILPCLLFPIFCFRFVVA